VGQQRDGYVLFDADGSPLGPLSTPDPLVPAGVCLHPDRKNLLALGAGRGRSAVLLTVEPGLGRSAGVRLPDFEPGRLHAHAVALDDGRCWVAAAGGETGTRLRSHRWEGDEVDPSAELDGPEGLTLSVDPASRVVAATWPTERGIGCRRLADEVGFDGPEEAPAILSNLLPPFDCAVAQETSGELRRVLRELQGLRPGEATDRVRKRGRQIRDPGELCTLLVAGRHAGVDPRALQEVRRRGLQEHPDHLELRHLEASAAADRGRWDEVTARIGDVDPKDALPGFREHLQHLQGLVALRRGDGEEALRIWEASRTVEPRCQLDGCRMAVRLLLGRRSLDDYSDQTLVGRIVRADRSVAAGDPATAIDILDRRSTWAARELQSMARLADVALSVADRGAAWWARAAATATAWIELFEGRSHSTPNLPLLASTWSEARLEQVAARARAWLEAADPVAAGWRRPRG